MKIILKITKKFYKLNFNNQDKCLIKLKSFRNIYFQSLNLLNLKCIKLILIYSLKINWNYLIDLNNNLWLNLQKMI